MYSISEDYRFFIKKIKYPQEIVYEDTQKVDDSLNPDVEDIILWDGFTFLDTIRWSDEPSKDEVTFPDIQQSEQYILDIFKESFILSDTPASTSLFDITAEYPDQYREYSNKHMSLYMFPTKTYSQVYNIFDVLRYDLPYSINETNSFWQGSFFINLEWSYADDIVRIVFKYENKAFWLKIKKDSYTIAKQILQKIETQ